MTERKLSEIINESSVEVDPINNSSRRRSGRRRKDYPYTKTQFHKVRENWIISYKEMFVEDQP